MARARLTAPGGKEALMAMRSRSIRRCAIIKQKTRKDPLTGKPLFGDEEQSVFDDNKSKDKTSKENPPHNAETNASFKKLSKVTEDPTPAEAATTENLSCLKPADSQLEVRMDKLEGAMRNLTDLMMKMNEKLDQVCSQLPCPTLRAWNPTLGMTGVFIPSEGAGLNNWVQDAYAFS